MTLNRAIWMVWYLLTEEMAPRLCLAIADNSVLNFDTYGWFWNIFTPVENVLRYLWQFTGNRRSRSSQHRVSVHTVYIRLSVALILSYVIQNNTTHEMSLCKYLLLSIFDTHAWCFIQVSLMCFKHLLFTSIKLWTLLSTSTLQFAVQSCRFFCHNPLCKLSSFFSEKVVLSFRII